MIVRPAPGIDEDQAVLTMPWFRRSAIGLVKAWFKTSIKSMVSPSKLIAALPRRASIGAATQFAMLTSVIVVLWLELLLVIAVVSGLIEGPFTGVILARSLAVFFGQAIVLFGAFLLLWAFSAHVVLRITGPTHLGFTRSLEAFCYSSGTSILILVPFLVPCVVVWWAASAIAMLKHGQGVTWLRATSATLVLPCAVTLLVPVVQQSLGNSQWAARALVKSKVALRHETATMTNAILLFASNHGGVGPAHPSQLATIGALGKIGFITSLSPSGELQVRVGERSLEQFLSSPIEERREQARIAENAMPREVTAYRLGDYVFTYYGIDLTSADSDLWIVVQAPQQRRALERLTETERTISVGTAGGLVKQFPVGSLNVQLERQNRMRAMYSLPPVPHPGEITVSDTPVEIPSGSGGDS